MNGWVGLMLPALPLFSAVIAVVLVRPALPRRRLTLGDELEDLGARVAMPLGLRAAGWPEPLERRAELLRCTNGRRA